MLEPTATPIDRSILSLIATVTAVACSAALPTMGRRIRPTNVVEMPASRVNPSMEDTMNSEQKATRVVEMARVMRAPHMVRLGSSKSSSSSVSLFWRGCAWEFAAPPRVAAEFAPMVAMPFATLPSRDSLRLTPLEEGSLYMETWVRSWKKR